MNKSKYKQILSGNRDLQFTSPILNQESTKSIHSGRLTKHLNRYFMT